MTITLTTFFLLPLVVMLGMIFTLWIYYGRRRTDQDRAAGEGKIYRCENCRMVYVERRMYPVLECPRCHHPNQAIRR